MTSSRKALGAQMSAQNIDKKEIIQKINRPISNLFSRTSPVALDSSTVNRRVLSLKNGFDSRNKLPLSFDIDACSSTDTEDNSSYETLVFNSETDNTMDKKTTCPEISVPALVSNHLEEGLIQPPNEYKPTSQPVFPKDSTARNKSSDFSKMQSLEDILVQTDLFHIIYGQLHYYTGVYHKAVGDSRELLRLMRSLLSENILNQVPNINKVRDVYNYLLANPDITIDVTPDFEKEYRDFIIFDNLIFDAKTGKTRKHNIKWPVQFQVLCDFDPEDMYCPHFDKFLEDISHGDEEVIELILQVIGYIMMQNSSLKKFFLFAPEPDTGKSVLGDFIASLFPRDCTFRVQLSDFNGTFTFGSLSKRTLGMGMDLKPGVLSDEAVTRLKLLTGEKIIDVQEKFLPFSTIDHHCKFLFASNHPIEISTPDNAFWSRLVLVPFLYPINPDDKNFDLPELLQSEKSAIATKCAFAAQRLVANNYQFIQPASSTKIINAWRRYEHDPVVSFINTKCTITHNSTDFISTADLHALFEIYCSEQGFMPLLQKTFTARVKERFGLQSSKQRYGEDMKSLNVICGIKLKDPIYK